MWRGGTKAPENTFSVHRRRENAPCTLAVSFVKVCKKGRGKRRRGGGAPGRENGKWEERDREGRSVSSALIHQCYPTCSFAHQGPSEPPTDTTTHVGLQRYGGVLLRKVGPLEKGSNIKRQIDRYRLLLLRPTVVLVFPPRLSGAHSKEKSGGGLTAFVKGLSLPSEKGRK